jgi:hypothetical protein
MKKNRTKAIRLNRETLRNLEARQLGKAVGATQRDTQCLGCLRETYTCDTNSPCQTCADTCWHTCFCN